MKSGLVQSFPWKKMERNVSLPSKSSACPALKKNDHQIFKALAKPQLGRLLSAAQRRTNFPELAEDPVQESYLQAWQVCDLSDPTLVYP